MKSKLNIDLKLARKIIYKLVLNLIKTKFFFFKVCSTHILFNYKVNYY